MMKTETYGFSEDEAATPASLNRILSSHMCMIICMYNTHTQCLLKHSTKKAYCISMRLGFPNAGENFTSSLNFLQVYCILKHSSNSKPLFLKAKICFSCFHSFHN